MPNRRFGLSQIDIVLLSAVIILMSVGILFIFSSGMNPHGESSTEYIKQLVWVGLGLILASLLSLVKYDIYRDIAPVLYIIFIFLVILTAITGHVVNGAKSWLGVGDLGIQPSEFLKIATILFLAGMLERWGQKIQEIRYLALSAMIVFVPMGVILMQPDLGTALVFIPIYLFMIFIAGAKPKHIIYMIGIGACSILFTMLPAWDQYLYSGRVAVLDVFFNNKLSLMVGAIFGLIVALSFLGYLLFKRGYFVWISYVLSIPFFSFIFSFGARYVLKEYQMKRLLIFMDPYFDAKGSGWNIIQSVTAVGSGGLTGKGYLQGTQSHLSFLPEKSTDFIFSILSEEWGFLGGLIVFSAFAVVLFRSLIICQKSKDSYGSYIAAGIVGMIFFHLLVNVGMAIGVMPITGIPLFFLSYGGSSLWAALIAIGILMSINAHRYHF